MIHKKTPYFSIVTVSLNNIEGLKKTHKSIMSQEFDGFEWIVMDGGSQDGSADYLDNISAIWQSTEDEGIYDAMNKGIDQASGQYILFLNAGDKLASDYILASIVEFIQSGKGDSDFVYGDSYEETAGEHNYKPARSHEKITVGMFTHHQAMFYNRKALGELRYNLDYSIAADYDFTCRFLQKTGNAAYLPLALCIFESGGISQQNATQGRKEQFEIRRKLGLISFLTNIALYMIQGAVWGLRKITPGFYWRMKSSGNKKNDFAQI